MATAIPKIERPGPPILAIVGSTCARYADCAAILKDVLARHNPRAVISGGAEGVDSFAAACAKVYGLPVIVCEPAGRGWKFFEPRNLLIAELCDRLVRIASARSKTYGSGWTRDRAAELGKPTEEFTVP